PNRQHLILLRRCCSPRSLFHVMCLRYPASASLPICRNHRCHSISFSTERRWLHSRPPLMKFKMASTWTTLGQPSFGISVNNPSSDIACLKDPQCK
ncbi:hypothetical protein S245_057436, partial [Arachis hypogaea]